MYTDTEHVVSRFPYVSGFQFTSKKAAFLNGYREWKTKRLKKISTKLLQDHFEGKRTMALPLFTYSSYLIIDIDNRSQIKKEVTAHTIFEQLKQDFGQPFYYEISSTTGNYHVYFNLKEYLQNSGVKGLISEYQKMGYVIEVLHGSKKLRLPLSQEYKDHAYDFEDNKIETIDELVKTFNYGYNHKNSLPQWLRHLNKHGEAINKSRTPLNEIQPNDRTYGNGTRHIYQIRIAFDVIRDGGTYQDFWYRCEYWNDGSSKDMMRSHSEKDQMLSKIWSWAIKYYQDTPEFYVENGFMTDEFGNFVFLNEPEFQFEDRDYERLDEIIRYYFKTWNTGKTGGRYEEKFVTNCILLLEAINSKRIWDEKTQAAYSQQEFAKLSNTTLFNSELKKKLAEQLGIENYKKVWKFLEDIKAIRAVQVKGYTYSYKKIRFAKHYKIARVSILYTIYQKFKKFSKVASNKFTSIINNSSINTIYINGGWKKNINYVVNFSQLTDGRLFDRLLKVQFWKANTNSPPG